MTGSAESFIFSMRGLFDSFPFGWGMGFLFFFEGLARWPGWPGGCSSSCPDINKSDVGTSVVSMWVNTPCNRLFLSSRAVAASLAASRSSRSASTCPVKGWVRLKPGKGEDLRCNDLWLSSSGEGGASPARAVAVFLWGGFLGFLEGTLGGGGSSLSFSFPFPFDLPV